ncbi:MAG: 5'/3'-nucleotidase SurE [Trueperaceae bacterium]|nr:5'/3'-nucleotidase SurE [Trueperaceae bacterium]
MKVLISNDDGIFSPGLHALAKAVREVADEVLIVAPDVEQSASGHAITVRRPLRYQHTILEGLGGVEAYRVDGTPADCVVLGVHNGGRPDVVISGINLGSNLGFDVTHSGTVAAAMEGTTMGIPSIAFSLRTATDVELDFSYGAAYAAELIPQIVASGLPPKTLLNVNFPTGALRGVRLTQQSTHGYEDSVVRREDPDGRPYYWISGTPVAEREADTDYTAVVDGYASVTPLRLDFTHRQFLDELAAVVPGLGPVPQS